MVFCSRVFAENGKLFSEIKKNCSVYRLDIVYTTKRNEQFKFLGSN